MCKFPEVKLQLVGLDGNAFVILGTAIKAARRAGVSKEDQEAYHKEATSGNYDHLLVTTMDYFNCDSIENEEEEMI